MSIILTLSVLVTWLTFGVAFCALGGLFFDRIGRIESSWEHLCYSALVGIALTVLALMSWHFLFPIGAALGPFAALSAAAIVVERRWFRPLLDIRPHVPLACVALLVAAWTANHSLASGGMDDYNYEFQAVRWIFEHPLIPGLANLHGRLGFNNSHHLLAALMSAGHWAGHVNHILNGFIVVLVLVYVLSGLMKVGDARDRPSTVWLFAAVLLAPVVGLVLFGIFGPAISTLKADVLVSAAIILLSCVFLRFAAAAAGTPEYSVSAATAILVGCFLVTVKLSAAAFCAVIVLVVLVRVARDARTSLAEPSSRRLIGSAGAAGVLLVCGFLARGSVLSGYPLYPSSFFGLDVDWRVPLAQVEADRVFIKTWSQLRPTYDLALVAGQEWVRGWLNSLILTQKLTIILPLVLIIVIGQSYIWGRQEFSAESPENPSRPRFRYAGAWALPILCGASLFALVVWFTQAPAARFASIYFWIPLAATIVSVVQRDGRDSSKTRLVGGSLGAAALAVFATVMLFRYSGVETPHHAGVLAVVAFGTVWAVAFLSAHTNPKALFGLCVVLGLSQIGERVAAHALRGRIDDIGAMAWYNVRSLPREPVFEHMVRQTQSGLTVYVSRSSSFRTPIPNTRYFNPYLELRVPNDLRSGFRNRADASMSYGYTVDYVIQPNAGAEIVIPAGE